MKPRTIYGVDFSGAKLAGRNIWVARCAIRRRGLELVSLDCLENLSGSAEREMALQELVARIKASRDAIWAIDFPFGLPLEVVCGATTWRQQLNLIRSSRDAYQLGLDCVGRARKLGGPLHIRRTTDMEVRTPFDCYHYRIIYQTFHGMRDVLLPLARNGVTSILPFHYRKLRDAKHAVIEACPGSTLKRLKIAHQNYKQPTGGPLNRKRLMTRRAILARLREHIPIDARFTRVIMRNPGGDALDAVISAVGAHHAWNSVDHHAIAKHPRYPREGFIYA